MKQAIVIVLALLAAILGISTYFQSDWMLTAMFAGIGLFVFGKVVICMYMMQGHGIFPRRGYYGLNVPMLVFLGIESLLIVMMLFATFFTDGGSLFPETVRNMKAVSVVFAISFAAPFVYWVVYLYEATFYGSEYDARVQFKNQGDSDDVIEEKIDELTGKGAFGKVEGWWPSFLKAKDTAA